MSFIIITIVERSALIRLMVLLLHSASIDNDLIFAILFYLIHTTFAHTAVDKSVIKK